MSIPHSPSAPARIFRICLGLLLVLPWADTTPATAEDTWSIRSRSPNLHLLSPQELRDWPAAEALLDKSSGSVRLVWDLDSNRPHLAQGRGWPLFPGTGNDLEHRELGLDKDTGLGIGDVERLARLFITRHERLLRTAGLDLRLDALRSRGLGRGGGRWNLELQQFHQGLPVLGARVFLRVVAGNVVQLGTLRLAAVSLDTQPRIGAAEAAELARRSLDLGAPRQRVAEAPKLVIMPVPSRPSAAHGLTHRLAWSQILDSPRGPVRVWNDAHDGTLLDTEPLRIGSLSTFEARGSVRSAEGGFRLFSLPFLDVQPTCTSVPSRSDEAGLFLSDGTCTSTRLQGRYIGISDQCGAISLSQESSHLDLGGYGSCEEDCGIANSDPGGNGNTEAARTAYFHASRLAGLADDYLSGDTSQLVFTAETNLSDSDPGTQCNAFWDGAQKTLKLYQAGAGCTNTGTVPGIVSHEWGHGLDDFLGGLAPDGASVEAAADVIAFLGTGDSCIGRGLKPGSSCQGCRIGCSGLRDLEPLLADAWPLTAHPETIADPDGMACTQLPPSTPLGRRGPLGFDAHCESQIASAAVVDLGRLLAMRYGPELGGQKLEQMWFFSMPGQGSAYGWSHPVTPYFDLNGLKNPGVDGCRADSWYSLMLVANDDDGDLGNGTPDQCLIDRAFSAHGISCPSSWLTCSAPVSAELEHEVCIGDSVTLGPDPTLYPGYTFSWSSGQTSARITVSPTQDTIYTLEASEPSASPWKLSFGVKASSCGTWFESFDEPPADVWSRGWRATGLWHLPRDWDWLDPFPLLPTGCGETWPDSTPAMRFAIEDQCTYDTCTVSRGDLFSPSIDQLQSDSVLYFDSFLEVEEDPDAWDRVEVAAARVGSDNWTLLWARDSSYVDSGDTTIGPIHLGAAGGHTIRLRFRVNTYDRFGNDFAGWTVDNVDVTQTYTWANPPLPSLNILAPGPPLDSCKPVWLEAVASSPIGGDLRAMVTWTLQVQNPDMSEMLELGTGSPLPVFMPPGTHQLIAEVRDVTGQTTERFSTVHVSPGSGCSIDPSGPGADPRAVAGRNRGLE